jgi:hypothetical protein
MERNSVDDQDAPNGQPPVLLAWTMLCCYGTPELEQCHPMIYVEKRAPVFKA